MRHAYLLILLLPFAAVGQSTPKALLWSIRAPGTTSASYVYGTVHSKSEQAYAYSTAVERTMDSVGTVAGELDLEAERKGALTMMSAMMLPDGQRLEDLYRKKDWPAIEAALRAHLGDMTGMFMRFKPIFLMAMLTESAMPQDRAKVLDDHLLSVAKERGHRVVGVETLEEQLRAMDAIPLKDQARMLQEGLERNDHRAVLDQMMGAYVEQDLDRLMALASEEGGLPQQLERSLISERNTRMVHRMDSLMRADGGSLFLIGAAHLPGPNGLLAGLAARGYAVAPVAMDQLNAPSSADKPLRAGYVRFTDDTLGFRVDFPGAPKRLEQSNTEIGVRLVNWYAEQPDGTAHMVFTCYLAPEMAGVRNDTLITVLANGDARNPGELLELRQVNSPEGLITEASAYYRRVDRTMWMRMVRISGQKAFLLLVSPPQGVREVDPTEFYESFRVLQQP